MKHLFRRAAGRVARTLFNFGLQQQGLCHADLTAVDRGTQILLSLRYQELLRGGGPLPALDAVGFRAYSQTDEDGILLYLFSTLGHGGRRAVEIGAGDGIECNTANLVINHGWSALMLDGDAERVQSGTRFYSLRPDVWIMPPRLAQAWVRPDNVNSILAEHSFDGDLDLLSTDVDGVDYWLWKAVTAAPSVVVLEYNNMWGPDRSVTVPYSPEFSRPTRNSDYYGASLAALVKLGQEKGYRLVGCNHLQFNAFFVRSGLGEEILPAVPAEACLDHPFALHRREHCLPQTIREEWVDV